MATIVKEDSPWTQLLGGVGEGLSAGVKIGMAQKQQEIDLEKEILAGTASGKYDPRIWASKAGRDFLVAAKIEKRPGIQELIRSGEALLPREPSVDGKNYTTPSGDIVNVPIHDEYLLKHGVSDPRSAMETKKVQDIIEAEANAKKLQMAQLESDIIGQRQIALDALRWARQQNITNPAVLIEQVKTALVESGADLSDWNITANSKGQISVTYNKDTTGRVTPNKAIDLSEEFDKQTSAAFNKRTQNIRSLSGILAGDVSLANVDVDPSDPVAVALKAAAEAISSAKGSTQKIMERASRVKTILKSLNEEIDVVNRSIENAGKRAGKDKTLIETSKIKHVEFEDISGGVSEAEWLKNRAKEDQPAKDLAADIRRTPLVDRDSAGRVSETRAGSDADRLKRVYDGLKDVVLAAVAANPALTTAEIKSNILSMKREIMAEYGLNERLWSMLVQMSDRVMG